MAARAAYADLSSIHHYVELPHRRFLHQKAVLTPITVGIIAGAAVFSTVLLLVVIIYLCRMWISGIFSQRKLNTAPAKLPSLRPRFRRETSRAYDPRLESLSMRDLARATNGFDMSRVIGDGGFGLVFSAVLQDGRTVAVKKLSADGLQGIREFEAEMDTLGLIRHQNLVKLLAYCKLGDERALIYEFMENGSLDTWLHEREDGPDTLDWKKRLKIAKGSACGLAYLHHDCNPHVIHRDIKSSNILLGKDFEPRIADFGLARNMSPPHSHVSTAGAGTFGYMAPECAVTMVPTLQADVYSFGMLMVEVASGRRPSEVIKERDCRTMVRWARLLVEEAHESELLDSILQKKPPPPDQLAAYLAIAYDCIKESPAERPTMRQVYQRLSIIGCTQNKES